MDIYGKYADSLTSITHEVEDHIRDLNQQTVAAGEPKLYEHLIGRVKGNDSMIETYHNSQFISTIFKILN